MLGEQKSCSYPEKRHRPQKKQNRAAKSNYCHYFCLCTNLCCIQRQRQSTPILSFPMIQASLVVVRSDCWYKSSTGFFQNKRTLCHPTGVYTSSSHNLVWATPWTHSPGTSKSTWFQFQVEFPWRKASALPRSTFLSGELGFTPSLKVSDPLIFICECIANCQTFQSLNGMALWGLCPSTLQHSEGKGRLKTRVSMVEESARTRYVVDKIYLCTNLGQRGEKGEGKRKKENKKRKKRKQIRITCNICNSKEKWVLQIKMLCQPGLYRCASNTSVAAITGAKQRALEQAELPGV